MQNHSFNQLLQILNQKKIPLGEYLEFISFENSSLPQLHKNLKQQQIELKDYFDYLAQKEKLLNELSPEKELEFQRLKNLGLKFLAENKISLQELNTLLQKLPGKKISQELLLQSLVKSRKITALEFLNLKEKEWTKGETKGYKLPYKIRQSGNGFEFYLENSSDIKKYGSYEILEELGRGGMGIVYKAYHPQLNQTVALKVLIQKEGNKESQLKRFLREIQTLAKLEHPGIIKILDSGIEKDKYYFAMEFIEGLPLSKRLKKQTLRNKITLLKKCLIALDFAHQNGIIHRDLKLDNILVTQDLEPKIADFGLAKKEFPTKESQKLTQAGDILGTLLYMSPEQAKGDGDKVDARSDIYSMGVILYQFLTATYPFQSPNVQVLLYKIINIEPQAPSKLNQQIHPDLELITLKALEKDPEKRYQNTAEFALDIEKFLTGVPIGLRAATQMEKVFKWTKRNKKGLTFSIMVTLSLLFLIILSYQLKVKEQQTLFNHSYKAAEKELADFYSLKEKKKKFEQKQLKQLLTSLHLLNQALKQSFSQNTRQKSEEKKQEVCLFLLDEAYKQEQYQLAEYIIHEMKRLSFLSPQNKNKLEQQLTEERNNRRRQHKNRLNFWVKKLKAGPFTKREEEDALYEIIKMSEQEIFESLLSLLNEGNNFFLHLTDAPTEMQHTFDFYCLIARILGRMENPQALKKLSTGLTKLAQPLSSIPNSERPYPQLNYLVTLTQSIANLKKAESFQLVREIRWKMGQGSLFWSRTKSSYKKLFLLQQNVAPSPEQPTNSNFYYNRGIDKHNADDLKGALQDYDLALRSNPKHFAVYNNRGLVKFALKDYQGAIIDFNQYLMVYGKSALAFSNRGLAQTELKNFSGALEDFNQAILLRPKEATTYLNRANTKKDMGDIKGALKDYNQALLFNPKLAEAYHNRANTKEEINDLAGALADFNQTIHLRPKDSESYQNRANIKKQLGNFDSALLDLNQAIQLNPKDSRAYLNRGFLKYELGDATGALQDINEGVRLNPKKPEVYQRRGYINYRMKRFREALEDFDEAIRLAPKYAEVFHNRGFLKYEIGHFKAALLDYSQAIKLNPKYAEAYDNRGVLREEMNDLTGALKDFNQAIKLNPKKTESYNSRGLIKERINDLSGAFEDYNQVIQLDSKNEDAFFNRANLYYQQGNFQQALLDYSQVIRLNPKAAKAYQNRGVVKFNTNDSTGSLEDLNQAILLNPKEASAYTNRGVLKENTKDLKGAIEDYLRALSLLSEQKEIPEKLSQQILKLIIELYRQRELAPTKKYLLLYQKCLPSNHPKIKQISKTLKQIEKQLKAKKK